MLAAAFLSAAVLAAPMTTNGTLARTVRISEHAPVLKDQIIFITPELYTPAEEVELAVVGEIPSRVPHRSQSERERLGAGEDAPQWIVVRFRDGLFAIDPFIPLPDVTPETARQLFKSMDYQTGGPIATLGTDRSLFNRKRIEATEELFRTLEHERIEWLKRHRYLQAVRSWSGDAAARSPQSQVPAARPLPEDMPRTRPIEEVRAPAAGVMLLSGDQPVRISMPDLGIAKEVRDRVASRQGQLTPPAGRTGQVARVDRADPSRSDEQ